MASRIPANFAAKKSRVVEQLELPAEEYDDLSPKGTVDEGARDLIRSINQQAGLVTTSSCAGRVSIFLEGTSKADKASGMNPSGGHQSEEYGSGRQNVTTGGKGNGGRWLFVSHQPLPENIDLMTVLHDTSAPENQDRRMRLVRFQFEPLVRESVFICVFSPSHCKPDHSREREDASRHS